MENNALQAQRDALQKKVSRFQKKSLNMVKPRTNGKLTIKSTETKAIPDHRELKNRFLEKGYNMLGSGEFGWVFACKNANAVIKVGNIWRNTAYLAYVEEILKYQENPFFPKIFSVKKYIDSKNEKNGFFVIKMEKLRSNVNNEILEFLVRNHCNGFSHVIGDDNEKFMIFMGMPEEKINQFKQVNKVLETLYNKGFGNDVHSNNIMMRGEQPVITDPVADFGKCGVNK